LISYPESKESSRHYVAEVSIPFLLCLRIQNCANRKMKREEERNEKQNTNTKIEKEKGEGEKME
jgi:hypothetical protein